MNICVYCGASEGNDPAYASAARKLGAWIASSGHGLVFGAGGTGLMGAVGRAAIEGGAHAVGVIPEFLKAIEEPLEGLDEVIVTDDMASRRLKMIELSDAFVALPGGPGTVEELSEIMSLKKLGRLDGPLVLLNINGFYDTLIAAYDKQVKTGFSTPQVRAHLSAVASVEELASVLDAA